MNRNSLRSRAVALMVTLLLAMLPSMSLLAAQQGSAAHTNEQKRMPVVSIDALEGDTWSIRQVVAAPGQRLIVTNRDVQRHNFTLDDWGLDLELLTLTPVEVIVPSDVAPGSSYTFTSMRNGEREPGMEGTIVIVTPEQILAAAEQQRTVSAGVANRTVIEIDDSFAFQPSELHLPPGALVEVRNEGSIEHHFVLDAWHLNETIAPGEMKLVRVPDDAVAGETLDFYCSVPGHKELGMVGSLTIVPPSQGVGTSTGPARGARIGTDLRPFIPDPAILGGEWTQLRTGNANAIIAGRTDFNEKIFPGEGLGAAYVGPDGSRVTIVVLPLATDTVPANQVRDSIQAVQTLMMQTWTTDRLSSTAMQRIPPPKGCDVALRASGIVPVLTLPAGSTTCELRNAGVAIFVAVEGGIDGESGVDAADALIVRMLSGAVLPSAAAG